MNFFGIKNKQMEILQKMQENLEKSEQNISALADVVSNLSANDGNNTVNNVDVFKQIQNNLDNSQMISEALFDKIEELTTEQKETDEITGTKLLDVLQKTQENLDKSQVSTEQLIEVVNQLSETKKQAEIKEKSDEEKLKAAYALNLCTVSVSQIIDYNDIYFLEHEYEAILNNLNLEQMPKDEALLNILKQLLDVITYFRIQEGDRKMMEKEYQHKMKNAIWSAVPNIGLIVAGGNPVTMAISLASQVGIGYMNYRKSKAENELEKEKQEWELQRSAMEQFNGLRRELFDTAWKLADEYNFPDEYRLTERQISQYNEILMDSDYLKRYERLEYIKDKFLAYPPFWYYLGNAANKVAQDNNFPEETRNFYKEKAIEYFNKFIDETDKKLLREDQLLAAGALELFDLIDDTHKKKRLLEKAVASSGNAHDVQQLCALSYINMGNHEEGIKILRMLVNEDYNKILNAQLLSQIYAAKYEKSSDSDIEKSYQTLSRIVDPQYLFPLDNNNEGFIKMQKEVLLSKYTIVLKEFIKKYMSEYNTLLTTNDMLNLLSDVYNLICEMPCVEDTDKDEFYNLMETQISLFKDEFQQMISGNDNIDAPGFDSITRDVFKKLTDKIKKIISNLNEMSDITQIELQLRDFCIKCNLSDPIVIFDNSYALDQSRKTIPRTFSLEDAEKLKTDTDKYNRMKEHIKKFDITNLIKDDKKAKFLKYGESEYFKNIKNKKNNSIAILRSSNLLIPSLVFTTEGIDVYNKFSMLVCNAEYSDIKYDQSTNGDMVIDTEKYNNKFVDLYELMILINELKNISK